MTGRLDGTDKLLARLRALRDGRAIMHQLALDTTREAKLMVPRKTATLARSIAPYRVNAREAVVRASAHYAAYVERGTRPHVIRPRNAKALRFPARGVSTTLAGRVRASEARKLGRGAYTFARSVNHPGTKAKPYLLPAARKAAAGRGLENLVIKLWNDAA